VDEKENDLPLGRQNKESDFIGRAPMRRMSRRLFFRTSMSAEALSMLYYALDLQGGERQEANELIGKRERERNVGG
jgi:hypothetical protein